MRETELWRLRYELHVWQRVSEVIRTERLSLPADAIDRLGLTLQEEIEVKTEAGVKKIRIFKDAMLEIKGRKIWYNCIELPAGESAVVGTLPLFALGLEIDWQNQQIKVLPTEAYMRM